MSVIIVNCFHWVAYHLTDKYLNEGISLYGLDRVNDEKKEFLYEMIGRNSNFHLLDSHRIEKLKQGKILFSFADKQSEIMQQIKECNFTGERYYIIEETNTDDLKIKQSDEKEYFIYTPKIVGSWMNSADFRRLISSEQTPIYIDDFICWLYELPKMSVKPNKIRLNTKRQMDEPISLNEVHNHVSIISTRTKEEMKKIVETHILNYPVYYGQL